MSLVIEALRRVEKTDARTGSIGAAVASYRPTPRPRSSVAPLFLGLITGGVVVFLFGAQSRVAPGVPSEESSSLPSVPSRPLKGAAGLPPPMIIEPAAKAADARGPSDPVSPSLSALAAAPPDRRAEARSVAEKPLVLQAISERDSRPIAIINDLLVREGEKLGPVRVLKIGTDSVEVLLENGKTETVRFAPPPPPTPEASPSPGPHS